MDEAKLQKAIAEYKVGSFLNAPPVAQKALKSGTRLSVEYRTVDGEIGIPSVSTAWIRIMVVLPIHWAALFPQNINMGAAFNPDLTYEACNGLM